MGTQGVGSSYHVTQTNVMSKGVLFEALALLVLELPLPYLCLGMVYGGLAKCAHRSCLVSTWFVKKFEHLTHALYMLYP